MEILQRIGAIAFLLLSSPLPATTMTEKQQLDGLEQVQEWEAAYPLALKLADKNDSFADWFRVADRYAEFDRDGFAYLKAWQHAERDRNENEFRQFAKLRPKQAPPLSELAVHEVFKAIDARPDVAAYAHFIEEFPEYPESGAAMLRVHGLLYTRAKTANTLDEYDRFAAAFPEAEQAREAEATAWQLEKEALARALAGIDPARREDGIDHVANQLLTQAIQDEHAAADPAQAYRRLSADRKFRLLRDSPELKGSHALLAAVLREEDIERFKALATAIQREHEDTRQQVEQARRALVDTVTTQNRELKQQITVQGDSLKAAIDAYGQATERRLALVDGNLAQLKGGLDEARRQLASQRSAGACDGWGCAWRMAADLMPGGAYARFGASLLAKVPVIQQFLSH